MFPGASSLLRVRHTISEWTQTQKTSAVYALGASYQLIYAAWLVFWYLRNLWGSVILMKITFKGNTNHNPFLYYLLFNFFLNTEYPESFWFNMCSNLLVFGCLSMQRITGENRCSHQKEILRWQMASVNFNNLNLGNPAGSRNIEQNMQMFPIKHWFPLRLL